MLLVNNAAGFGAGWNRQYDLAQAAWRPPVFNLSGEPVYGGVCDGGIAISADGSKLYMGNSSGRIIRQHPLSTAFIGSTYGAASYSLNLTAQFTNTIQGFSFSPDGTKLFVNGEGGSGITKRFDLSTAWDLSTASFVSSFNFNTLAYDIFMQPDGLAIYRGDPFNSRISRFALSPAWDITSAASQTFFNTGSMMTTEGGVALSADGTNLFISSYDDPNDLFQVYLPTPWSLSGAYFVAGKKMSGDVHAGIGAASGLAFSQDMKNLYFAANAIAQFSFL